MSLARIAPHDSGRLEFYTLAKVGSIDARRPYPSVSPGETPVQHLEWRDWMAMISRMIRLGQVLLQPCRVRSYLWKPISITAFTMLRTMREQGLNFRTVIDGGANAGQFSRAVTETYPEATIIAFEALPVVAETLRRNLADRPQVRIIHSALGRQDGIEVDSMETRSSLPRQRAVRPLPIRHSP